MQAYSSRSGNNGSREKNLSIKEKEKEVHEYHQSIDTGGGGMKAIR